MNHPIRYVDEGTVVAVSYESRGRQDCLLRMRNGAFRMRHLLRLPKKNHPQVSEIIDRVQKQLNRLQLPSIARIETHYSAGRLGYYLFTTAFPQATFDLQSLSNNYVVDDPLQYSLQLGQQLQVAAQTKLFHHSLSPSALYRYGDNQILLFGLGVPALGLSTNIFTAPEVVNGQRVNEVAMVYSLGMMLFALHGGCFILGGDDPKRSFNQPLLEGEELNAHPAIKQFIHDSTRLRVNRRIQTLQAFNSQLALIIEDQHQATLSIRSRLRHLKTQVKAALQPTKQPSGPIIGKHLIPAHLID